MVLMEHFDVFHRNLQSSMENIMAGTKTFKEPGMAFSRSIEAVGGSQVFGVLAIVLFQ